MPDTALMGYTVQATGTNSGVWGEDLNDHMISYVDSNFAGITSLSLTNSNVLLTASQARNQMIRCTGTLTGGVIISPDTGVLWNGIRCVENLTSGAFNVTLQNSAGSVVMPQGRRALVFLDTTNGPRIVAIAGSSTADPIPAGSKTIWYNASAPSGWTAVALNDYAIKIVTNGSGAVTSGSVAYSTVFGRTKTDGHELSESEIPNHYHFTLADTSGSFSAPVTNVNQVAKERTGSDYSAYQLRGTSTGATIGCSSTTGGGDSHSHNIDMRVNTAAFVLATKD